jgi:hypothetical protein
VPRDFFPASSPVQERFTVPEPPMEAVFGPLTVMFRASVVPSVQEWSE